jgi:hypothetical protein
MAHAPALGLAQRYGAELLAPPPPATAEVIAQAALATVLRDREAARVASARSPDPQSPVWTLGARRLNSSYTEQLQLKEGDRTLDIHVRHNPDGSYDVTVGWAADLVSAAARGLSLHTPWTLH